ncbi:cation:proton antiporter [Roseovarius arcticus]|uniref:cation:proton antiporter domain-containing protein n=1 Tax=Roseovarius arcticus TaxID=2547404 RepID=UPI0011105B11|nr:cation:proton antiporter [Roseovarius arcticus]
MEGFLYQASIYLAAAVIAVPIAARLGLGSVLGYLAAGILIGPLLGLVGQETAELQHFAEFGVVMMLFLIGLELEPRALWDMRHRLLGLGGMQVLLTTLIIMVGVMALGYDWSVALAVGLIFALSSTAIVLQTLSEKGLMQTKGGRSAFSVLLTQDISVIPMLALLPLLAMRQTPDTVLDEVLHRRMGTAIEGAMSGHPDVGLSLVAGLPGWGVTLVTLAVVGGVILTGVYLTRPVFRYIHAANLREMFTALALLIVCGISFIMYLIGLSPALGAFLAGVVLANSEFRHELESDIQPFKGLLLGLFFITVGAGINFALLFGAPFLVLGLALMVIVLKGAVLYILGRVFELRGRDLWLFTLSLAQAGEFGFVLISFSGQQNVVPSDMTEMLLLIVAMSMLITPLLFIFYDWLSNRMEEAGEDMEDDDVDEQARIIIVGIGRFGQIVNRLVRSSGYETVVLDHDLGAIQRMRRFGVKGFFGDPTRPEMLHAAGLKDARVLVAALDDPDAAVRLVAFARRERPDLHIIARARDRNHVFRLYQAGADDIVREMFDASLRAGRYVLENMGVSEFEAAELENMFYHHDRHSVRELASLWDPDVPTIENEKYIARARELEDELETMLLSQLEESADTSKKSA